MILNEYRRIFFFTNSGGTKPAGSTADGHILISFVL